MWANNYKSLFFKLYGALWYQVARKLWRPNVFESFRNNIYRRETGNERHNARCYKRFACVIYNVCLRWRKSVFEMIKTKFLFELFITSQCWKNVRKSVRKLRHALWFEKSAVSCDDKLKISYKKRDKAGREWIENDLFCNGRSGKKNRFLINIEEVINRFWYLGVKGVQSLIIVIKINI